MFARFWGCAFSLANKVCMIVGREVVFVFTNWFSERTKGQQFACLRVVKNYIPITGLAIASVKVIVIGFFGVDYLSKCCLIRSLS